MELKTFVIWMTLSSPVWNALFYTSKKVLRHLLDEGRGSDSYSEGAHSKQKFLFVLLNSQPATKKQIFFSSFVKTDKWLIYCPLKILLWASSRHVTVILLNPNLTCRRSGLLLWLLTSICPLGGPSPPLFPVCPYPPFPGFLSSHPIPGHRTVWFALWTLPYAVFWNQEGIIWLLWSTRKINYRNRREYFLSYCIFQYVHNKKKSFMVE